MQIMSQSRGSNSQGLQTSVAGKLLLRKLIESKTFYIFTFSFEIQKRSLGSSNFSWSLKHEIFPIVPTQDLQDKSILGALDFEFAVSTVSNSKSEKWKPYQKWSSQERFMIGKYAAINDPAAAAKKIWIKEPSSQWKYRKRVFCHVQSWAWESQKKKTSHCAKSK